MKPIAEELPDAARHPIAVVAERTGLSQDVLRVWERRYGVVHPVRAPGGQRLYSDADVDRLALLHAATGAGRSIGQIAGLSTSAVEALVEGDLAARAGRAAAAAAALPGHGELVADLLALARSLDAAGLDGALRRAGARLGLSDFLESVAAPLLRLVGEEWHAGRLTPAQEHLVSVAIHDMVVESMRGFAHRAGAPGILVTTPAGDRHVVGAALVCAAAAVEGWNVIYLGADLPAADIAGAASSAGVDVVALSAVYAEERGRLVAELRDLRSRLDARVTIIAGGAAAAALAADLTALGVRVETSMAGLVAELRRHRDRDRP